MIFDVIDAGRVLGVVVAASDAEADVVSTMHVLAPTLGSTRVPVEGAPRRPLLRDPDVDAPDRLLGADGPLVAEALVDRTHRERTRDVVGDVDPAAVHVRKKLHGDAPEDVLELARPELLAAH